MEEHRFRKNRSRRLLKFRASGLWSGSENPGGQLALQTTPAGALGGLVIPDYPLTQVKSRHWMGFPFFIGRFIGRLSLQPTSAVALEGLQIHLGRFDSATRLHYKTSH